jgi:hypothetical protein
MPDSREEIEQRMDELAREYGRTPQEILAGGDRQAAVRAVLDARSLRGHGTLSKPMDDVSSALIVLEDAVNRCTTENVNTPEVLDAPWFSAEARSGGLLNNSITLWLAKMARSILIEKAGARC